MKWLLGAIGVALLGGCATEESIVMPETFRSAMRQQPTAVLFTDDVGEIRYIWGRHNTVGANRPDRTAPYQDQWDAGPAITAVHAQELTKLGFQTKSIYEVLTARDASDFTSTGREQRARNYENVPILTRELRDALLSRGERYLFWVTWSGLEYFHVVLPLTPEELIASSYWLFDLNTGSLVWSGGLWDLRDSNFKYAAAPAQLEADHFAGLAQLVEHRYRLAYRPEEDSVPWLLGLVRKP